MTTRVQSCCPDPSNKIVTEDDYDDVSLSLARTMLTCALALRDAGYAVEGTIAEAKVAIADQERLQARRAISCPGCGCEPGDGRTPDCQHPIGCGHAAA